MMQEVVIVTTQSARSARVALHKGTSEVAARHRERGPLLRECTES